MSEWIRCNDGFVEADVIRWKEAVWQTKRRRQDKALRIGERLITAEVIEADDEWIKLLVRGCTETARFTPKGAIELYKNGVVIRRARKTI